MNKYRVNLEATARVHTSICVKARSDREAENIALNYAPSIKDWQFSTNAWGDYSVYRYNTILIKPIEGKDETKD
jgi:hypothetical protein